MGQTISERLEYQSLANRDRQWINDDLYRLLYKADLYILAYERIKSKPGNMTPGTDGETLDGFSMETIQTIIEEMRTEQFRFKPVRTTFIPKANGKMRRLGIPCVRDKVVQEACASFWKPSMTSGTTKLGIELHTARKKRTILSGQKSRR